MSKKKQRIKPPILSPKAVTRNWSDPNTRNLMKKVGAFSIIAQCILYLFSYFVAGYPLFSYMFIGNGRFDDLRNGIIQNKSFFSPQLLESKGFASVASPPMIFIWQIYEYFVKTEGALWISLLVTFLLLTIAIWLVTRNVFVTIFFATLHPVLFTFARGNPDMWVLILTCLAGISFIKGQHWITAIIFGLMGALKFPFLLFGLIFVLRKDFKNLALQGIVTSIAFLLPLTARPWGIFEQINVFNAIVANYYDAYVIGDGGLLFNVSLFGLIKPWMYLMNGDNLFSIDHVNHVASIALTVQLVMLIILSIVLLAIPVYLYFKSEITKKDNKKSLVDSELYLVFFLLLVVIECLYPQVAAEYRLAQLVIVIALLFKERSKFLENRFNLLILTLIFLPKHFLVIGFSGSATNPVTVSSFITPMLLTWLLYRIQIYLSKNGFYSPLIRSLRVLKNRSKAVEF